MNKLITIKKTILVLCLLLFTNSSFATIIDYQISQEGWKGGGVVKGVFSGEDIDNNGFLSINELSSYDVNLSGNIFIDDFVHSLTDLQYFNYTINTAGFRPSYPLFSNNGTYFYDADDHVIGKSDYSLFTSTQQDAMVSKVPAPSTLALMAMIGLIRLKKFKLESRA